MKKPGAVLRAFVSPFVRFCLPAVIARAAVVSVTGAVGIGAGTVAVTVIRSPVIARSVIAVARSVVVGRGGDGSRGQRAGSQTEAYPRPPAPAPPPARFSGGGNR